MRFSIFAFICAAFLATTAVATRVNVEIGYFSTIVPTPGTQPGIGCGLWARATADTGGVSGNANSAGSDGCPNADIYHFCKRWSCPRTLSFFGGTVAVGVKSSSTGSLQVEAAKINGKKVNTSCGASVTTISKSSSGAVYRQWICYLDL